LPPSRCSTSSASTSTPDLIPSDLVSVTSTAVQSLASPAQANKSSYVGPCYHSLDDQIIHTCQASAIHPANFGSNSWSLNNQPSLFLKG
jgi:hypothetical protein